MAKRTSNKVEADRLNKAADGLEEEMKKVGQGARAMVQEQRNFIDWADKREKQIETRLEGLRVRLQKYLDGDTELDDEFNKMKDEYYNYLLERKELRHTAQMAQESIAEYEMSMPTGVSTEEPVMGPNFGDPKSME